MAIGTGTALLIGAAGAAAGAVGASKAGKSAGAGRDYSTEGTETLADRVALAPDIYAAESNQAYGQPAYARLETDILREQYPRLLDIYEQNLPRVSALEADAREQQRESDISDVNRYGPQMRAAFEKANPELFAQLQRVEAQASAAGPTEIERQLEQRALDKLKQGGELTAEETWRADQDVRSAFQASGRSRGNAAITSQVLNRYGLRRQREAENETFATGVNSLMRGGIEADRQFGVQAVGLRAGATVDPAQAVLGRPSTNSAALQSMAQQANSGQNQPGWFDPWADPYAQDLYNTNYNAQVAARTNKANMWGALGSGLLSFGGAALGGMGG